MYHQLMTYIVVINKGHVNAGAGCNVPFLIVECVHFAVKFLRVLMSGADGNVYITRNFLAIFGQSVGIRIHNHAFFIHQHVVVIHHGGCWCE